MTPRRLGLLLLGGAGLSVLWAGPAGAHGVGALGDLPLPRWQFAWAVGAVVVIAFFVVGSTGRRPRLDAAAEGRALPAAADRGAPVLAAVAGFVGVVGYGVIVTAGLFGSEFPAANIAPIGVFITFWVGLQFVSILFGDLWRVLSPFETLARVGAALWARLHGRTASPVDPDGTATHWPAVVAITGFVWLELAYHAPTTTRLLGGLGLAYGVAVLTVAARRGRGWLRTGEGFAALFSLLAALAPLCRAEDGRLRVRWPLTGLARLTVRAGTLPLLFVVLGATVFDGLARTTFWADLTRIRVGWGYTAVSTLGLLWTIGVVAFVYLAVTRLVAGVVGEDPDTTASRYAPVLVPIAAAYTVAHYFALFALEGQGFWYLLSNPYGEGWDLFGTADGTIDLDLVSASTIVWVQAAALTLGHVGAVLAAHDRALTAHPPRQALTAQYLLLALILTSATTAIALLLGT